MRGGRGRGREERKGNSKENGRGREKWKAVREEGRKGRKEEKGRRERRMDEGRVSEKCGPSD